MHSPSENAYGSTSPFAFSLGEMGYVGLQEPPFNDTDFRTQNLYWRQRMNGGRSTLIAGVLDVTDYVDAFALASPWLHFMNFAFSTGSAGIGRFICVHQLNVQIHRAGAGSAAGQKIRIATQSGNGYSRRCHHPAAPSVGRNSRVLRLGRRLLP